MKILLTLSFTAALAACATKPKRSEMPTDNTPQQSRFDQGVKALDSEQYQEAARIFDSIILQKPGTEMDLVAIFNSGIAYENMADCKRASDRYRQVVRSSAGHFKRIEGEALFRLSLAYECMGQDAKTVTALIDAKRRGRELSFETTSAEIPARLAAAYSRLGNREKALEYFTLASRGLKSVVSRGGSHVQTELIARTLYQMGKLSPTQRKADVDPGSYLQSLSMQQPYLLQAMELTKVPWSNKAGDDLQIAYQSIWNFKFDDGEKQRDFYTRGLQTINELRKIRMPNSDPATDSLFAFLDKTELQLQNELTKLAHVENLTPAAQKREGLRREGRLVDPKVKAGKKSRQTDEQ